MKLIYGLVMTLTILAFAVACEDDETIVNTVYDTDSTKVLAIGEVVLRPSVDFRLNFLQLYAQSNTIDSVIFADSLCPVEKSVYYADGNELNYRANYYNLADSLRWRSGDTARVTIYHDDSITTADIPLLMSPDDSVVFDYSVTDTVVSVGQPVNLAWTPVDGADWYGMMVYNWYDSLGFTYTHSWYAATDQASHTFSADGQPAHSRYDVRIIAVTGSVPGQGLDNLIGPGLVGTIYCATRDTKISIRVGQGAGPGVTIHEDLDEMDQSIIQNLCNPNQDRQNHLQPAMEQGDFQ